MMSIKSISLFNRKIIAGDYVCISEILDGKYVVILNFEGGQCNFLKRFFVPSFLYLLERVYILNWNEKVQSLNHSYFFLHKMRTVTKGTTTWYIEWATWCHGGASAKNLAMHVVIDVNSNIFLAINAMWLAPFFLIFESYEPRCFLGQVRERYREWHYRRARPWSMWNKCQGQGKVSQMLGQCRFRRRIREIRESGSIEEFATFLKTHFYPSCNAHYFCHDMNFII